MTRLEMKNYNKILTKNQQKYLHYHQVKLINMNILQVKKYLLMRVELQNKLSLLILLQEKLQKNKQKQLRIKEKNKLKNF